MTIYTETLSKSTEVVFHKIKNIPELSQFYLTGGTALALQLGHRESEDLDFFAQRQFNPYVLQEALSHIGHLESVQIEKGTFNVFLDGVKLQFLYYPYELLEKTYSWNGIFLSSVLDISCTKLITISMRGSKKDFIDMFVILKKTILQNLFHMLEKKYRNVAYNNLHILKSLTYFEEADVQPLPRMHISLDWEEVKKEITLKVKEFSL